MVTNKRWKTLGLYRHVSLTLSTKVDGLVKYCPSCFVDRRTRSEISRELDIQVVYNLRNKNGNTILLYPTEN